MASVLKYTLVMGDEISWSSLLHAPEAPTVFSVVEKVVRAPQIWPQAVIIRLW